MAGYARINSSLWVSSSKWKALGGDDRARLLYFYLHTNTHRNKLFTYVLPVPYAALDLSWKPQGVRQGVDSLCDTLLIGYDEGESVVHIHNALSNDPPTNQSHCKALLKEWEQLPDSDGKLLCWQELTALRFFPEGYQPKTPCRQALAHPVDTHRVGQDRVGSSFSEVVPSTNSVPSEVEPDPEYPPWVAAVLDDWISVCPLPKATKPEKCHKTIHDLQSIDGHPAEHVAKVCAYIVRNKAPTYIKSPMKLRQLNSAKDCQTFEMYATEMVNQGNGKAGGLQEPDPHRYQPKDYSSTYVESMQPKKHTGPQSIGDVLEEGE